MTQNNGRYSNNKTMLIVITVILMIINFSDVYAVDSVHPNMFLDQEEINTIKSRINNNQYNEQWKTAYNKLMESANSALKEPVSSVTFAGNVAQNGNNHDYWTDPAYSSDGIYDPNADRSDYVAAIKLRDSVRDLGLVYQLTGDSKYADKTIEFINAWTINPKTKMNPKYTNQQSKIELAITIPGMFYGADLIWNYPGWNSADRDAFIQWTREFIVATEGWAGQYDNNFELWRLVTISSGSIITGDSAALQDSFNRWKVEISEQMDTEGKMIKEYKRTRGLTYSLLGIDAFLQTAEIARHQGVDLYNYKTEDGKGIELALDYVARYASGAEDWPYQEIRWDLINYGLFEMAYSFKQKSSYKDVIIKRGRPMHEGRIIGPVTLTHSEGFAKPSVILPNIKVYCYKKSR